MSEVTGTTLPGLTYAVNTLLTSPSTMRSQLVQTGAQLGEDVDATRTVNQPTPLNTNALTGNLIQSFFEDFYNKIWLTPYLIQFGEINSESTARSVEVVIFNTYVEQSVKIDTLTLPTDAGITIDGFTQGDTLRPMERLVFSVIASPTGIATLSGYLNVGASAINYAKLVPIAGTRFSAFLLPISANWADTVNLTLSYKTDIITSRDGTEQRRALRQTPRRTLTFTALVVGDNCLKMKSILRRKAVSQLYVADPTRTVMLADGLPAGSETVSLADIPRWATKGAYLVFACDEQFELRKIYSLSGNTIQFAAATNFAWQPGTRMSVGLLGRLSDGPQLQNLTTTVSVIPVSFICDPASDPDYTVGEAGTLTDGREVLPFTPQWGMPVSDSISWKREAIDNQFGLTDYYAPALFGMDVRQAAFLLNGNAQDMIDFFCRMRGEAGEFFASSFVSDLTVSSATVLTSTNFIVINNEIGELYNDDTLGLIEIKMDNGDIVYRNVVLFTANTDGTVTFQLDSPVSGTTIYTLSQIIRVSWLMLSRFMSDDITLTYLTDSVATVNTNIASRPYQAAQTVTITDGLS